MTGTPSPPQFYLAAAIRLLREEAGLSQEELALAAETHPTEISHLESGRRNSSWGMVTQVAKGLGVRVSDIALLVEKLEDGKSVN